MKRVPILAVLFLLFGVLSVVAQGVANKRCFVNAAKCDTMANLCAFPFAKCVRCTEPDFYSLCVPQDSETCTITALVDCGDKQTKECDSNNNCIGTWATTGPCENEGRVNCK